MLRTCSDEKQATVDLKTSVVVEDVIDVKFVSAVRNRSNFQVLKIALIE